MRRFFSCLSLLLILGTSLFSQVESRHYLDAYNPIYTAGTAGDMCAAGNNALNTTFTANPSNNLAIRTNMLLDLSGFENNRGCMSNLFHGSASWGNNISVDILLGANTNLLQSVTQYSPNVTFRVIGQLAGNIAESGGTTFQGSGPACTGAPFFATFTSGVCSFTDDDGNIVSVPQLSHVGGSYGESSSYYLNFANIPHGPVPAGTIMYPLWVAGGQGSTTGSEHSGMNANGDAWEFEHLKFDFGGNTNTVGIYSSNNQERTVARDIRIGFNCGTAGGGSFSPQYCFGIMGDRAGYSTGGVSSGQATQAGSTRMSVEHFNYAGELLADCPTCGGLIFEGTPNTVVFGSETCTVPPTGFIANSLTNGTIDNTTIFSVGNPGVCSVLPTTFTVYAPPNNYGDTPVSTAHGTVASTGTAITGLTLSAGSYTGYVNSPVTGGPMLFDINCAGVSLTIRTGWCFWEEGTEGTLVSHLHVINPGVPPDYSYKAAVVRGTGGVVQGGVIQTIDSPADVIHLGNGHDNGGVYTSLSSLSGTSNFVIDDKNAPTALGTPFTLASSSTQKTLPIYVPNFIIPLGNGWGCPQQTSTPAVAQNLTVLDCDSTNGYNINVPSANTNIFTAQTNGVPETVINKSGQFSLINGQTTGGVTGAVAEYANSNGDLVNQNADVSSPLTVYTPVTAGTYRVTVYVSVWSVGGATTWTVPTVCLTWTDQAAAIGSQVATIAAFSNPTKIAAEYTTMVDSSASSPIKIASGSGCGGTSYASSPATFMKYRIRTRIEAN